MTKKLPFLVLNLLFVCNVFCQSDQTLFEWMYSEDALPSMVVETDLKELIKNKYKLDKVSGKLEYKKGATSESWNIDITARGKSRRKICNFPPLKLAFSKKQLKKKGLRKKHNTFKLVTHCKNTDRYEDYVKREFVAYRLYNQLTDYSFRVQMVLIEYRDSENRMKPIQRLGFIIEDVDELADRLNAKEKDKYDCARDTMDHFHYDVMALFQYMISNTDWNLSTLHNMKVIQDKETGAFFPIPYDFDYSGFVNTIYSVPNPDLPQSDVTDRVYMGKNCNLDDMLVARARFLDKKDAILSFNQPGILPGESCKKMTKFLKSFYKTLSKERKFKRKCVK